MYTLHNPHNPEKMKVGKIIDEFVGEHKKEMNEGCKTFCKNCNDRTISEMDHYQDIHVKNNYLIKK